MKSLIKTVLGFGLLAFMLFCLPFVADADYVTSGSVCAANFEISGDNGTYAAAADGATHDGFPYFQNPTSGQFLFHDTANYTWAIAAAMNDSGYDYDFFYNVIPADFDTSQVMYWNGTSPLIFSAGTWTVGACGGGSGTTTEATSTISGWDASSTELLLGEVGNIRFGEGVIIVMASIAISGFLWSAIKNKS